MKDLERAEGQTQRKQGLRIALAFPPGILMFMGLLLTVTSPLSWGAAEVLELPAWMPPAFGLFVGLGTVWVASFALRRTLRETRGDFEVFWLQTIFGVAMFLAAALTLSSLISRLPDQAFYRGMLDDDGEDGINATAAFIVSLVYAAFQIAWVWAAAYLYSHAFSNLRPTRLSLRRSDEADGIGELLREREG